MTDPFMFQQPSNIKPSKMSGYSDKFWQRSQINVEMCIRNDRRTLSDYFSEFVVGLSARRTEIVMSPIPHERPRRTCRYFSSYSTITKTLFDVLKFRNFCHAFVHCFIFSIDVHTVHLNGDIVLLFLLASI